VNRGGTEIDSNERVRLEEASRFNVNQYFQHSQRDRLGQVDDGHPWTIPAAAVEACSLCAEGHRSEFGLDEAEGRAHEAVVPCLLNRYAMFQATDQVLDFAGANVRLHEHHRSPLAERSLRAGEPSQSGLAVAFEEIDG
jgi:hypothetical protein